MSSVYVEQVLSRVEAQVVNQGDASAVGEGAVVAPQVADLIASVMAGLDMVIPADDALLAAWLPDQGTPAGLTRRGAVLVSPAADAVALGLGFGRIIRSGPDAYQVAALAPADWASAWWIPGVAHLAVA